MTPSRELSKLAPLELVVLARCSSPRAPSEKALALAVLELASAAARSKPDAQAIARAAEQAGHALAALRRRGLIAERKREPTEAGYQALRADLGLGHVPSWADVRAKHLPARALGLGPGSAGATRALKNSGTIVTNMMAAKFGVAGAQTMDELCDQLLAQALGVDPASFTMTSLRAAILAKRAGVTPQGTATALGARLAANELQLVDAGKRGPTKTELVRGLGRRWLAQQRETPPDGASPHSPSGSTPRADAAPRADVGPTAKPAADLLHVVRETLPRVGPDGRFGAEKVFVSAIWRTLDRRAQDLSLDGFKRWLLDANRSGQLKLARADLVGTMDAKLVADSEIRDQGATFHFVLDLRNQSSRAPQRAHVR